MGAEGVTRSVPSMDAQNLALLVSPTGEIERDLASAFKN